MLAVLPTGYGKSLIYQLLAPTYNFMDFAGSPGGKKSTVIVISPLNALIRDQIVKMREGGLNVSVLRGDRVDTEDGSDDPGFAQKIEIFFQGLFKDFSRTKIIFQGPFMECHVTRLAK